MARKLAIDATFVSQVTF